MDFRQSWQELAQTPAANSANIGLTAVELTKQGGQARFGIPSWKDVLHVRV